MNTYGTVFFLVTAISDERFCLKIVLTFYNILNYYKQTSIIIVHLT